MSMEDWDKNIVPHLNRIAIGAEMASRHARQLPQRTEWETHSQIEMDDAKKALEAALKEINAAMAAYDSKPLRVTP